MTLVSRAAIPPRPEHKKECCPYNAALQRGQSPYPARLTDPWVYFDSTAKWIQKEILSRLLRPSDLFERPGHAVGVSGADTPVALRRQPFGAEEVDVRLLAAHEEHAAAGADRGVDLRRQDVADEFVAQGDEVCVGGDQQAGQQVEGHRPAAVDGQALLAEDLLHPVRLGAGRVEPEGHAAGPFTVMAAVAFDERLVVVGDAEVS